MTQVDTVEVTLSRAESLRLLIRYKNRTGTRHSWGEVALAIGKNDPSNSSFVTRQSLANWKTRGTEPNDKAYCVILGFILSEEFKKVVPEVSRFVNAEQFAFQSGSSFAEFFSYDLSSGNRFFKQFGGVYEPVGAREITPLWPFPESGSSSFKNYLYFLPSRDFGFGYVHILSIPDFRGDSVSKHLYSGFVFLTEHEGKKCLKLKVKNRRDKKVFERLFDFKEASYFLLSFREFYEAKIAENSNYFKNKINVSDTLKSYYDPSFLYHSIQERQRKLLVLVNSEETQAISTYRELADMNLELKKLTTVDFRRFEADMQIANEMLKNIDPHETRSLDEIETEFFNIIDKIAFDVVGASEV